MPFEHEPHPDSLSLPPGTFVKSYEIGECIGQGRFSDVYSTRVEGKSLVLKVLRKSYSGEAASRDERKALARMAEKGGTPHVVHLLDSFVHDGHDVLVVPRYGQDLLSALDWRYDFRSMNLVEKDLGLPLPLTQKLARDIVAAVTELHKRGYLHGDLKPENMFLSRPFASAQELYEADPSTWWVVVGDLGSAFPHDWGTDGWGLGTGCYRSPEITVRAVPYSEMIDWWAVGCIIFELRTRCELFDSTEEEEVIRSTFSSGSEGERSDGDDMTDSSEEEQDHNIADYAMARTFQRICGKFPGTLTRRSLLGKMLFTRKGLVRDTTPSARKDEALPGIVEVLDDFPTMRPEEKTRLAAAIAPFVKMAPNLRSRGEHLAHSEWMVI